ncbi:hypothetical protein MZE71_22415, partial [Escherichia coli]|nr:hypothetical protein [Escherichia coli]
MSNTYQKRKASKEYGLYNKCKKLNDDELFRLLDDRGFAPIFPDTCYHLTHYWPAAADIPV